MSKYHERLQLHLFKNKLNEKSLTDFIKQFSSDTVKNIMNDLEINSLDSKLDNKFYIFSDGNVKNNGKKHARGGYSVYFGDKEKYCIFNKTRIDNNEPTNNKLELSGIKQILKTIYRNEDLFRNNDNIICTDSQYSINCIEKWSEAWIRNGWINSKKEDVKNKELIQEILIIKDAISNDIKITFKHIYGHTEEPRDKSTLEYELWFGNNKVDVDINKILEENK